MTNGESVAKSRVSIEDLPRGCKLLFLDVDELRLLTTSGRVIQLDSSGLSTLISWRNVGQNCNLDAHRCML